ncbi:MAG: hypothetical protein ACI4QD_08735 [Kiritimatiellia bacterium]
MYRNRLVEVWASGTLRDVTEQLAELISTVYCDNAPELVYFLVLNYLFEDALTDFDEDTMPNAAIGYENSLVWKKLFDFQRDAAIAIRIQQETECLIILAARQLEKRPDQLVKTELKSSQSDFSSRRIEDWQPAGDDRMAGSSG